MPAPQVTGVSPNEGPPGTLITIRGENLGTDAKDLESVMICGVEMVLTADWLTKRKITVRSGLGVGEGEILITTRSGGQGSSELTFTGQQLTQILPKQESAVYVDETHTFLTAWDKHRPVAEEISADNLLGLSDEGGEKKFPPSRLPDLFPGASGNVTTNNFSPYWYLLENNSSTSFEDLKAGLEYLKSRRSNTSFGKEPKAYLKTNLATFMECQDALVTMHNKLTWDENQKILCLDKLNMLLQAAGKDAYSLFDDIIRRKDKADATRNALGILNRFMFLFYLPPTIRANIAKGEYDVVINDYTRAKLLYKDTDVEVFKEFYGEVEKEVQKFRQSLHSKLLEMPAPLEEKKRIIRHLVDLEYAGNPAWECICTQNSWLVEVLSSCVTEHTNREHDEVTYGNSKRSRGRARSLSSALLPRKDREEKALGPAGSSEAQPTKLKTPQRVLFVEELSQSLMEHFPSFYRLGHAYFEGQLLRKERDESHKAKTEQKQNLQSFKQMINEVLLRYCNMVRRALLPESLESFPTGKKTDLGDWTLTKSELPSAWLPQCVRTVRQCAESLRNDLPPESESSNQLQELVFDLRTDTMRTILKQAIDDVAKLSSRETWVLDTNDSSGSTTQLPTLFENCVNEAVSNLNDVVIRIKTGEHDIFNDRTTQEQATSLCIDLVKAYIQTLEKCAFHAESGALEDTTDSDMILDSNAKLSEGDIPDLRRRLIITLSNCHYSVQKVMPRLVDTLDKHGYHETNKVMEYADEGFADLEDQLFEQYIELKVDPILGELEERMYQGRFEWSSCKEPLSVRDYIKDSITQIVETHAEVYSILSTEFLPRIMEHVVSAVVEEINRLIFSITKFNKNGALQARVDLMAFRLAVKNCLTRNSRDCIDEAADRIPKSNQHKDEQKIEKILTKFQRQFKFHLLAFEQIALPSNT